MLIYQKIFHSSIGRKFVMAGTGFLLIGFLLGHMLGNLQIFLGQDALNSYAKFLQESHGLVWVIRTGLLVIFLTHVRVAVALKRENLKARPVNYTRQSTVQASLSSRTMILSGLVILLFLVYHLLHYTLGEVHSRYYHLVDAMGRHDVYTMVVLSFREPLISLSYVSAMTLLAFHLRHALPGMFQSVGWSNDSLRGYLDKIGIAFALILFVGYTSIPVSILLKLIKLPGEVL